MKIKKNGLKVNYGAVEKMPLKELTPPIIKNPHQSLFRRLQSENKFVNGAGIGNAIADVFGNFTQSAGNRETPVFDEKRLPQAGPGRMQEMDGIIISPKNKNDYASKRDNSLLYIAAAIGIFLIIKSK